MPSVPIADPMNRFVPGRCAFDIARPHSTLSPPSDTNVDGCSSAMRAVSRASHPGCSPFAGRSHSAFQLAQLASAPRRACASPVVERVAGGRPRVGERVERRGDVAGQRDLRAGGARPGARAGRRPGSPSARAGTAGSPPYTRFALNRDPSTSDTSAEASAIPPCTSPPRQRGWSSSSSPRAALVVTTGMPVRSANPRRCSPAPEKNAPGPGEDHRALRRLQEADRRVQVAADRDRARRLASGARSARRSAPPRPPRPGRPAAPPGTRRPGRRTAPGGRPPSRTRGCAPRRGTPRATS